MKKILLYNSGGGLGDTIQLFTLGIMGIYLARIFEQTKGRDQYVIKEIKDYK